jgi:hypothetical protein
MYPPWYDLVWTALLGEILLGSCTWVGRARAAVASGKQTSENRLQVRRADMCFLYVLLQVDMPLDDVSAMNAYPTDEVGGGEVPAFGAEAPVRPLTLCA